MHQGLVAARHAECCAREGGWMTGPLLIEIEKLRIRIGGTTILHDVRLSLGRGEIYGLLGPNGAGKSTTIAAALGLLAPEAGRVRIFGNDPRRESRAVHARLGALPEQGGFYGWM